MSIKAFRWAKDQRGLPSSEKFVLIMIADHYNDEWHRAWPSHATLGEETGLSVPTVKRAIRALASRGLLQVEAWQLNEGGGWLSNRYLLPQFDLRSRIARDVPVLAFAAYSGASDTDHLRLPGSNLFVEADALAS